MFLQFSDVLHNFNSDFINHTKQNTQNPDFIWYD